MVITSLQEKQNRKFYVPIRPGNRGGWSLFEWQSVREMPYRDRQMYLGNSAVIGVLDKGGKWRKRDWYLKTDKKYKDSNHSSEQQQAIRRDMQRMNYALGNNDIEQDDEKLTQQQMQQLLKRIKNKDAQAEPSNQAVGLGFDKSKVQIRAKPTVGAASVNRLQGIDEIGQVKKQTRKQQKKQRKKDKQRSKSPKNERDNKQKKQKKQKKHKRQRSRSRSKSNQKEHRRRDRSKQKQERGRKASRSRSKDRKHKKQKKQKHRRHRDQRSRSRS